MPDYWGQDDSGNGQPGVPPMFRLKDLKDGAVPQPYPQAQFQPARLPVPQPARQPDRYAPPQEYGQQQYMAPQRYAARKSSLTAAEQFWYVLMNIAFGLGYFAKIPGKKALADFGLVEMTAAEKFWYVLMCLPMGAGYFAKIPTAKAIEEMQRSR